MINKALPLGRMFWCVRQFAFSRRLTLFFSVSTPWRCSLTRKTTQLVWYLFLFAPCVTKDVWRSTWTGGTNRNYRCSKKDSFQSFCFTFPTIQEQMNPGNIVVQKNHFHWFPCGMQLNQFKDKHALLLIVNLKLFLRCRNEFFSINTSWNQSSDNLFTSITEKVHFLTLYLR